MANNRYSEIMSNTGENERIHLRLRPVWRYYWKGLSLLLLTSVLSVSADISTGWLLLSLVIGITIVILRFRLLFTVTSKRVIMRVGLISNNTDEVEIRHTRELRIRQGVIERLLNYGNIEISTAAGSGPEVIFIGISYPHDLKEAIRHVRNGL